MNHTHMNGGPRRTVTRPEPNARRVGRAKRVAYDVELGIAETNGSGDPGTWFTDHFRVYAGPQADSERLRTAADKQMQRRYQNLSIAGSFLYSYEPVKSNSD
jgi:hypothetical protein